MMMKKKRGRRIRSGKNNQLQRKSKQKNVISKTVEKIEMVNFYRNSQLLEFNISLHHNLRSVYFLLPA